MKLDKLLFALAILLLAYAIFSRFYGKPSIAMGMFKSSSVLLLANTAMLLALFTKK